MYVKFWVLIFTIILSMNLYSSNKKMTVVTESTQNLNGLDSKILARKVFEELIKSKFI